MHPSSFHSYSKYDIALDQVVNQVIPGLNLFADLHRIHCGSLAASMLWVAKYQVKRGFYLEVQPLLTFLHYLACVVCRDLSIALEVKLLRVETLCALRDFEAAIHHFCYVINGNTLPKPADVIRSKIKPKTVSFNEKEPLFVGKNYQTLKYISIYQFNQIPYTNVYGKEFLNKVVLCQSRLLISIAEVIYDYPTFDELRSDDVADIQDQQFPGKSKDVSKESLKVQKSLPNGQRKKSREKSVEVPPLVLIDVKTVQPEVLKGKLLAAAEKMLKNILPTLVDSNEGKLILNSAK